MNEPGRRVPLAVRSANILQINAAARCVTTRGGTGPGRRTPPAPSGPTARAPDALVRRTGPVVGVDAPRDAHAAHYSRRHRVRRRSTASSARTNTPSRSVANILQSTPRHTAWSRRARTGRRCA